MSGRFGDGCLTGARGVRRMLWEDPGQTDVVGGGITVGEVLELPDRAGRVRGPAFDLVVSKLRRPLPRPGTVRRVALEDLVRRQARPVVSVVAPPGYGKTTLLAEWAEQDSAAFAWVSVDERDNDPKVFLAYVAEALDRVEPLSGRVFVALADPTSSVSGSVVPRLASSFAAMRSPVVLVVDDVHLLRNRECRSAISVLAENVPLGSRLVVAGRESPPLRTARLRAEDKITEVGVAELSMTPQEAKALLVASNVSLGAADVARLHRRTEGWPVGLYLAALYLREGGSVGDAAASFRGDDRLVSEYVESELLDRISGSAREFLTRSAALTSMSAGLCDAVLDLPGAAATLGALANSNLLLVPLDRRGEWYRYHHLFGDMLLAQLERLEPGHANVVRRRAADWCLDHDRPEEALEYSIAAGDVDSAAELFQTLWSSVHWQGRLTTLARWLEWLEDRGAMESHPLVAVHAARVAIRAGHPADADRWADVIDRWQADRATTRDPVTDAWASLAQALMCRRGVTQMGSDADEAVEKLSAQNIVAPGAQMSQGLAAILAGALDVGQTKLEETVRLGREHKVPTAVAMALSEQALLSARGADWSRAEALATEANATLEQAGMEYPLPHALKAHLAIRRGDVATARREVTKTQRLLPLATYAQPYFAVQTRLELARGYLALGEPSGARTMAQEISAILKRRPDLGTLADEVTAFHDRLSSSHDRDSEESPALTTAELRLLPLLTTHLTYPEIADERFLSVHTIHAQARSMFRKLGVSSRSAAVARSRELALLEG